jgi:transcriptional regulator with XRE-family HTH domain
MATRAPVEKASSIPVRSAANMADKQTLGDVVRERRAAEDMRLRELARRLDVTPSYVSDIENDRRVPSEEVLRRIADELQLDFDDLVARAGRIGIEAERYLRYTPVATTLFRRISEEKLTEDEIQRLLDQVKGMRSDKGSEQ